MTDIIVVSLLLIIIFLLIIFMYPEISIYMALGLCTITLILCLAIGIGMFLNDPSGFIGSLIFENPIMVFSKELTNQSIIMADQISNLIQQQGI